MLKARLEGITLAHGYSSDAGKTLFIGENPKLGPDDVTASIGISPLRDVVEYEGENITLTLPVLIQVIVGDKAETPWDTIEAAIADVKTAIEQDHDLDGTLIPRGLSRGMTEPVDRDLEFIGVTIEYRLTYKEGWGAP